MKDKEAMFEMMSKVQGHLVTANNLEANSFEPIITKEKEPCTWEFDVANRVYTKCGRLVDLNGIQKTTITAFCHCPFCGKKIQRKTII